MVLKISVLASGAVLVDGQPAEIASLEAALDSLRADRDVVWYFRQVAPKSASVGMRVIQMITDRKLPISLSSRSDFSDYLDEQGVSRPRNQEAAGPVPGGVPAPAAVSIPDDLEAVFANARRCAAGESSQRGLVLVRPDRGLIVLPALTASEALNAQAAAIERLIPSAVKRNVAVIADTAFTAGTTVPSLGDANRAIPFFGMLLGISYIGHYVWVFEGHPSALEAGCRDADVLLVDSGMLPLLPAGWADTAAAVMRNANILLHDRAAYKLRFVRKLGESKGVLEFAG